MKALSSPRPPTLSDIAREADVSLSTASRALNGDSGLVRDDLRDRVAIAARRLGYVPNAQAQSLVRATTSTVGLVVHDIGDPYFSTIAQGVEHSATEEGLLVMIASDFADPERELEYLDILAAQRVRAVILAGSGFEDRDVCARAREQLETYTRLGGRVAAISEHGMPIDTVLPDNTGGAQKLTEFILGQGHTELGVLTGPLGLTTWKHRLAGMRNALDAAGLELVGERVLEAGGRDAAYAATGELLERAPECTAIVAFTDVMAVGVMAALRDRGISVPEEMSVAGFDDIDLARDLSPPLTTVAIPMDELGRMAVRMIVADPTQRPRRRKVESRLVVRESVGAPRSAGPRSTAR